MKKLISIIVCSSAILLCSCQQETYQEECESLSIVCDELESKYGEVFNKDNETIKEQETTEKNVGKNEIYIEMPKLPVEASYMFLSETKVTTRVNKVTYTYEAYSDGTCSLTLYYSGEKLYDVDGEDGLNPCHFDVILYDENGNPVARETGSGGWIKTGERFKDIDDLILDVPLGHNYTLAIVDYN